MLSLEGNSTFAVENLGHKANHFSNMRVVFLGAGSSKALGLLLTGELLPRMLSLAASGKLFGRTVGGEKKRSDLLSALKEIVPGLHTEKAPPSITDLLSIVDYALGESFTFLQGGGASMLRRTRSLLEAGLLEALANAKQDSARLKQFGSLVWKKGTTVITTNYDFLPDEALKPKAKEGFTVDYGMPWRKVADGVVQQRPANPDLGLMKLHGGVNWLACPHCEHIYINRSGDISCLDPDVETGNFSDDVTCHCGYAPLRRVIVSPSLARGPYHTQLRSVHLAALEAMRAADEIMIVGYSLPAEDLLVRSLFLRAVPINGKRKKIHVFLQSEEPRPRYDSQFAQYTYHMTGFDGFMDHLSR